ncbi:MAG: hypothetical protein NXY57DRAFT_991162 [Lentinula lateritia]|nr:MAG: hypothetical protein NXY57DRAFT_991162 [Lentinula lateritia]
MISSYLSVVVVGLPPLISVLPCSIHILTKCHSPPVLSLYPFLPSLSFALDLYCCIPHTRFPLQIHTVLFPFELAVVFCYRSLTFSFDFPLFHYFNPTRLSSIPFYLYHF